MLIGKLSKRSGFSRDTIRYYEKLGIVATGMGRAGNGYKNYPLAALERLQHIRRLKECGFTLPEIRRLLVHEGGHQPCANLPAQLAEKIMKIDEKMKVLWNTNNRSFKYSRRATVHAAPSKACQTAFHPERKERMPGLVVNSSICLGLIAFVRRGATTTIEPTRRRFLAGNILICKPCSAKRCNTNGDAL